MSASPTPSDVSIDLSAVDDVKEQLGVLSPAFDKYQSDSDLVLKSSDNVLFPVHRARLAGSSVFRDMFDICGDSSDEVDESYRTDRHTLQLSESATILEVILPFFYDQLPDLDELDFDTIIEAFTASLKYGMTLVEHILTASLKRMLPKLQPNETLRLWARCTTLDKADLAAQALQYTAKGEILTFPSNELAGVDVRSLDKLWRRHMESSHRQSETLFKYAWQSARGTCYYFNQTSHAAYVKALLTSKMRGLPCEVDVPVGFHTCEKCPKMAEELDVLPSKAR